jgi:lysophospholipase L1-like esterase
MNRPRLSRIVIAAILSLAFIAQPIAGTQSGRAQADQVYLALGDSIPEGLLASLPDDRGYPGLLRDLMETERLSSDAPGNVELRNLAERGETIQTFRDDGQLDEALEIINSTPTGSLRTVTLTLGGNNILSLWESTPEEREAELQQFRAELPGVVKQLESALADHDADVVLTTYYDLTAGDPDVEGSNAWWIRQFNTVIEETADEAGFSTVDLEELFRGRIGSLTWFPADVHPNNAGHRLIARAIWQELQYDQRAPDVEITRPDSGESRNRVPTVHATVEDSVGADSVVLIVDGDVIRELLYVPDLDAWVGLWDARRFEGNEAELTVTATDVSGNESSDSVIIRLPSS